MAKIWDAWHFVDDSVTASAHPFADHGPLGPGDRVVLAVRFCRAARPLSRPCSFGASQARLWPCGPGWGQPTVRLLRRVRAQHSAASTARRTLVGGVLAARGEAAH